MQLLSKQDELLELDTKKLHQPGQTTTASSSFPL